MLHFSCDFEQNNLFSFFLNDKQHISLQGHDTAPYCHIKGSADVLFYLLSS